MVLFLLSLLQFEVAVKLLAVAADAAAAVRSNLPHPILQLAAAV